MAIVCLDTQILIWGIKEQASSSQENMILKASRFLERLNEQGDRVIVPSVVVAELLIRADSASILQHSRWKGFAIAPFDQRSAAKYAQIFQAHYSEQTSRPYEKPREGLKIDRMIVAIAITNGCNYIVSNDGDVKRFAGSHIEVKTLDEAEPQEYINFANT